MKCDGPALVTSHAGPSLDVTGYDCTTTERYEMTETADIGWPLARSNERPLDPPPQVAELRRTCPVVRVRLWDDSAPWLATRYDDIRAVLANPASSSDTLRAGFPHPNDGVRAARRAERAFIRADPPEHDEKRSMFRREFTASAVEAMYREFTENAVRTMLDDIEQTGPPADLVSALANRVPSAVLARLLGVPIEDMGFFTKRVETWMNLNAGPDVQLAAMAEIHDHFADVVSERTSLPGDDLLSRLILEHVNTGELAREELIHIVRLLIVAGFDTTANTIALGTLAFLQSPDQLALLRAQPELINKAVEEVLRYTSVTHHTGYRQASVDMEVGGYTVKASEGLVAPLYAANRDPERFPDPDRFDITRDARGHLGFGFGIHQCLGQHLARLELRIVFRQLVERFPNLRLAVPADRLEFTNAITYGLRSLPVTWDGVQPA